MGIFDKIFGGSSRTKCSRCGRSMKLVETGTMYNSFELKNTQGCFECRACGRLTCFDCSDNRYPCDCGAKQWVERMYFLNYDVFG
jgi:hypothetical protein